MPSTVVGLLIFVVALAPGLVFLHGLERRLPGKQLSVFRETVSIVIVGVVCDSFVLVLFAIFRMALPGQSPDIGSLIRDTQNYWQKHYALLLWWGVGLLLAACAVGLLLGTKWDADFFTEESAWWDILVKAYNESPGAESVLVYCELADGTLVAGAIRSWNVNSRDIPDRDLVLQRPIYRRLTKDASPEGTSEAHYQPSIAVMAVSARQIVSISATFLEYDLADVEKVSPSPILLVPAAPASEAKDEEVASEERALPQSEITKS